MKMRDLYSNFLSMTPLGQLDHIRDIRQKREQYFIEKFTLGNKPRKAKAKKVITAKLGISKRELLESMGILPENMEDALKMLENVGD